MVYSSGNLISPQSYQSLASQCAKDMFSDLLPSDHVSYSQYIDWLYVCGDRYLAPNVTIVPFEPTLTASSLDVFSFVLSAMDHNNFSFSQIEAQMEMIMNTQPSSEDFLLLLMSIYRPALGTNEYKYFRSLTELLLHDVVFRFSFSLDDSSEIASSSFLYSSLSASSY